MVKLINGNSIIKKYMLNKNNTIKNFTIENEIIRNFLLKIIHNKNINNKIKIEAFKRLNNLFKKNIKFNKKQKCIFTNKYNIYKISNVSRLMLKFYIESCL
jgi:hypothetical protein